MTLCQVLWSPEPKGANPSSIQEEEAPPASSAVRPVLLEPRGDRADPLVFKQGAHPPFGIRWYGLTSLFGHLRNFAARAIAAESVDSRDWMRPNRPHDLAAAVVRVLGVRAPADAVDGPKTVTEALGRPLWIDFAADTGDDRDVSGKVGEMLASTYIFDGKHLPRGDMLVLGGDVAYPVATADEIYKRLALPWNEALRRVGASARKRVLLAVPGNHDWYDGLDGFGRLVRKRLDEPFRADDHDPTPRIGKRLEQRPGRKVGLVARSMHLDEVGGFFGLLVAFFRSLKAFFRGTTIKRRRRLALRGYDTVQEASYFALPLAPGLDMWGADRQLGRVDFRQRSYFKKRRAAEPDAAVLFVAGDPAMAYGHRNDPGARMLAACRLSLERDRVFFLAGDFHHYERRDLGHSMHVIAGGGGAFLHGTRITEDPKGPPAAVYPSASASRKLVVQVPLKLMIGRAGYLVHFALGLLAFLQTVAARSGFIALLSTSVAISAGLALLLYAIALQGHGTRRKRVALSIPFAAAMGLLPMALVEALPRLTISDGAAIVACAFLGSLLFGFYLLFLYQLGLEHQQAFTVLGHPGYKHFVRLCIHPDGRVEGWTIGKDDMLAEGPPYLVDLFAWGGPRRTE